MEVRRAEGAAGGRQAGLSAERATAQGGGSATARGGESAQQPRRARPRRCAAGERAAAGSGCRGGAARRATRTGGMGNRRMRKGKEKEWQLTVGRKINIGHAALCSCWLGSKINTILV